MTIRIGAGNGFASAFGAGRFVFDNSVIPQMLIGGRNRLLLYNGITMNAASDLPTFFYTGWLFDRFPLAACFMRQLRKRFLGNDLSTFCADNAFLPFF